MSERLKLWFGLHIPAVVFSYTLPPAAVVLIPVFWIGDVVILIRAILS